MIGNISSYTCVGSKSYAGRSSGNRFPLPYMDYTSTQMWRSFADLLDWSEFIYINSGEIKEIHKRLFNYFNTEIEIRAVNAIKRPLGEADSDDWKELLTEDLKWPVHAFEMLNNVGAYGNDFISVLAPIERFLECPRCGGSGPLRQLANLSGVDFTYRNFKFLLRCPFSRCIADRSQELREFNSESRPLNLADKFWIKHWPVREMVLQHYEWSDRVDVLWKIPESYKKAVKDGDIETLAEADDNVLKAIEADQLFQFNRDRIFHAKEPMLSGLKLRGWGLPRTINLHKQIWMLHLLRKQVQSLALDYAVPIRLVSPSHNAQPTGLGAMTPGLTVPAGDFQRMFSNVLDSHRSDPTGWHSMPFPVDYSLMGGEASQLFPAEMIQMTKEDLIDSGGIPVELYKSNLTLQAAPVGLRLFEAQNRSVPLMLNEALRFVVSRVAELSGREPVKAQHSRVMIVDNIEMLMAQLQLATSGSMSLSGPLERMGVNFKDDVQRRFNEQKIMAEMQEKFQSEQMKRQESLGAMDQAVASGGAAPAQGGGQAPADPMMGMLPSSGFRAPRTIEQMEASATALAEQLSVMDSVSRENELKILREQDPTFHAVVMQRLDDVRYQQSQQGRQMMLQG